MKVLVTGASGFIGHRVVETVRQKRWTPIGTTRTETQGLIAANITNLSSFSALQSCGPFDAVVHCAGIAHRFGGVSEEDYRKVNVDGTRNVARFAQACGAKLFVHLSSVLVYGRHGVDIRESDDCLPKDAYAASKLASEEAAIEIGVKGGMAVTVLRPAPVIGEGCKGNLDRLIRAVDRGRFVNVGDSRARKSMIYVADVAEACVRVIEASRPDKAEIFNLAGEAVTTGELLESIYQTLGRNGPRFALPIGLTKLALAGAARATKLQAISTAVRSLETWTSDDVYATDAIRDRIGIASRIPVLEAVRRTVHAFKNKGKV